MPRTRPNYRATCTTVACADARSRTILAGLLVSLVLTFLHVPSVSAQRSHTPVVSMAAVAINGNSISGGPLSEITVMQGDRLTIEMFARNWTPQEVGVYQVKIDPSGYASGITGSLGPVVDPTPDAGAFIDKARPDFIFLGLRSFITVVNSDPSRYIFAGFVPSDEDCAVDAGEPAYLGTLVLDIGETAVGRFQMCLDEDFGYSFLGLCVNPPVSTPFAVFECLTIVVPADDCTTGEDCNGNGSWDICDIFNGTSEDCNGNGVPDECDIDSGFSEDCNGNGVPDDCDIDSGFSEDCNANSVPDECEPECNGNGVPDDCDIDSGFSEDCNGNGIPDPCDLDSGFSADCDGNGAPDECDMMAPAVHYAAGDGSNSVAIGDLDGDQVPDLAVANAWSDNVSVLLGVGDGTFVAAVNCVAGDQPRSVAIGDLDGDQVPDLVVANISSDNVSVLLGLGDGTFAAAVNYVAGVGSNSVAIGDLDGDQVPDLAVANYYSDNVSVLLGVGDGTFAPAMFYAAGDGAYAVAIADLDGDPDQVPDLAVANSLSDNVSVLLGIGDGTFVPAVNYAAADGSNSVTIGDLDGDQVLDLAVANQGSFPTFSGGNVSVLLGFGDGTFAPAVNYVAGDGPLSVAIADLDGDLVPDLAVVNRASDDVSVLLGVGDGTFAATISHAVGNAPFSIVIGDLDGDQFPDQAVANISSDDVSVLLHQSSFDCNSNCIPDDCDIDCGSLGGACDLPGCGQGVDCNGNGVPDECEFNDCNGNCIPDDCDVDCGPQGSACDLPDCGLSEDCNGSGVPDECELVGNDCNGNGLPDDCEPDGDDDGDGVCDADDLCPGGDDHIDNDGNGVPDACDFEPPILAPTPHDILKNRYISIDLRGTGGLNTGKYFAIRVTLSGTQVNAVTAVGSQWWVNAPDADCIAIVGPTRPVTPPNWDACLTLHLTGCPIIPTSFYDIVIMNGIAVSDPPLAAATQALPIDGKWWGDAVGNFTGEAETPPNVWTPPQGTTNFDDVNASLKTFIDPGAVNATHTSVTDIHPNRPDLGGNSVHPNRLVSIDDVFQFIQAFQGAEYPGAAIDLCPDP